jgi:hypothetical protein
MPRQPTVNDFGGESGIDKGLAMLHRDGRYGVQGEAASAAGSRTIPAALPQASRPTLLLDGRLLLIGP